MERQRTASIPKRTARIPARLAGCSMAKDRGWNSGLRGTKVTGFRATAATPPRPRHPSSVLPEAIAARAYLDAADHALTAARNLVQQMENDGPPAKKEQQQ